MANKAHYTKEQLRGHYVTCFRVISSPMPSLDCVQCLSGVQSGLPYLYNSEQAARDDKYFDPEVDEVVEAQEYFRRVNEEIK